MTNPPFFVSINPGDANEVLLRLAQQHESAYPETDNGEADGSTDPPVNILTVADLGDG
jgi:hypothetical protein